ncbi:hypothetical protein CEXT_779961 [Caerostris extrusa]|uniref:Secreted protein n=1 Tax=Caerostris extrusa TaxID=172846 RepID=A0AAV4MTQ5_CAEEX|nr:hypothetical protein CEXT_779961 [Caerostris extrusa]
MSCKYQLLIICMAAVCLMAVAKPQYSGSQTVVRRQSTNYSPNGQQTSVVEQSVSNSSPYGQRAQTTVVRQQTSGGYGK